MAARGSYRSEYAKRFAREKIPAEGVFAAVVKVAEHHTSKDPNKHNLLWRLTFKRLTDPKDPSSEYGRQLSKYPTLPFANNSVEGHEPPTEPWVGRGINEVLSTFFDDVPVWPQFDGKRKVWMFKDEPISRADLTAAKEEAGDLASQKAAEVDDNIRMLEGQVCWMRVRHKEDNGEIQAEFNIFRPESVDDDLITEPELFDVYADESGVGDPDSEANGASKPKRRSRSSAGGRAAKKKTSRRKRAGR